MSLKKDLADWKVSQAKDDAEKECLEEKDLNVEKEKEEPKKTRLERKV